MTTTRVPDAYASQGAVRQNGGSLPIYRCGDCGADVVWVTSARTGREYLANVFSGYHRQRYYIGASLHGKECAERVAEYDAADPERVVRREAEQAKREAAEPVPTGTETISGTVLETKWEDTGYGNTKKMLVEDERGWKVWGTVPGNIDPERGDTVTFTATVAPSRNDPKAGYYKRPRKATCEMAA